MRREVLLLTAALALPQAASAQCRMAAAGASCAEVRTEAVRARDLGPAPVEIGAILPRDATRIVHELSYYGLPVPDGPWVYMRIEGDLYRVDYRTNEVLERVTARMRRPFPDTVSQGDRGGVVVVNRVHSAGE
ncbi:hypothetical protein [Wenxinia marina]|uniref:Wenxma_18, whole genome shotgun sequence n=1 Tax=Wenxinia marina DSM 24838 TaxID=1123501 RepID=A0A0D0PZQ6_9RHOB|nr:hypothetical protein [Wenxinia marina]KIQ67849.1 hypothetical protein Wenmar_03578 [Wenxinia marina DSM 24838]GGL74572.1 hypothetical protein GCM10011392_31490 [Wenxinia marina]